MPVSSCDARPTVLLAPCIKRRLPRSAGLGMLLVRTGVNMTFAQGGIHLIDDGMCFATARAITAGLHTHNICEVSWCIYHL